MSRFIAIEKYLFAEERNKEYYKKAIKNKDDLKKAESLEKLSKEKKEFELFRYMNKLHWDAVGKDTKYTSEGWKNYKETYSSEIQELANNFIHPLIKHKDDKDFSKAAEEKSLTMMSKEAAYKYFETPAKLLDNLDISSNRKNVEVLNFEKYVLFNLYKDQQKYDYEYDK